MSDHYNLLGVAPEASAEELRRAFRREAKRCHPDLHVHRPPAEREALQRRFILLAQAYQVLSHAALRAAYDRQRAAERGSRRMGGAEARPAPRAANPSPRPSGGSRTASPSPTASPPGRAARRGPEPHRADPDVGQIRREAEQSLAAFGLDLRLPAEAALEQLLVWARGLYRDLAEAVRPNARTPRARQKPARGPARPEPDSHADAHSRPRPERTQAPHSPRQTRAARDTDARSAAGPDDPAIESELARLKRDLRSGGRRPSRAATVDDELAELKRKHGRKAPG